MGEMILEKGIRDLVAPFVINMMDSWDALSMEKFKYPIEIRSIAKENSPQFKDFKGEINLAYPILFQGQVILLVIVNDFNAVRDEVFAHEIGHWVLKLKGYKGIRNKKDTAGLLAAHVNDLCTHPAVWKLIRENGGDPQNEIDSRGRNDIDLLMNSAVPIEREKNAALALLIADDLYNCSSEITLVLEKMLKNKFSQAYLFLLQLRQLLSKHNLRSAEESNGCILQIQRALKLEGKWETPDEMNEIQKLIDASKK